jgi:hypothetical protein
VVLTDIVGDVEGGLVGPSALIPGLSSTAHGSIRVIFITLKFYLSHTASCAVNLLSESNTKFA